MFAFSNDHFFVGFFKKSYNSAVNNRLGSLPLFFTSPKITRANGDFFCDTLPVLEIQNELPDINHPKIIGNTPTRWALTGYKWSHNPYQWPNKKYWYLGLCPPISGVIGLLTTGRGPHLAEQVLEIPPQDAILTTRNANLNLYLPLLGVQ